MSGGRSLDSVWQHFSRKRLDGLSSTSNLKCSRAICKYCKKDIVALVARMKDHLVKCQPRTDEDDTINEPENMHLTLAVSELDQSGNLNFYVLYFYQFYVLCSLFSVFNLI